MPPQSEIFNQSDNLPADKDENSDTRNDHQGLLQVMSNFKWERSHQASPDFGRFVHQLEQEYEVELSDSMGETPLDSFLTVIFQVVYSSYNFLSMAELLMSLGGRVTNGTETGNFAPLLLEVKLNEIVRKMGTVTSGAIRSAFTNNEEGQSPNFQVQLSHLITFLRTKLHVDLHLFHFDWRTGTLSPPRLTIPTDLQDQNGLKRRVDVIFLWDSDLSVFRGLAQRRNICSTLDEYCDRIFDRFVQCQELGPILENLFRSLDSNAFATEISGQLEKLKGVQSVRQFISILLPGLHQTLEQDRSSLLLLQKYDADCTNSDKVDRMSLAFAESLLRRLKVQYALGLEGAAKSVLQSRVARHREKLMDLIENGHKMDLENDRLDVIIGEAEMEKRDKEKELEELEINLKYRRGNVTQLEKLVKEKREQLEETSNRQAQAEEHLAWNSMKKGLLQVRISYDTLKAADSVLKMIQNPSMTMSRLIQEILSQFNLPEFTKCPDFDQKIKRFGNRPQNDSPQNRKEILEIIKFILQPPTIAPRIGSKDVLEVTGRQCILSQILPLVLNLEFKELCIVAADTLYLDSNLTQKNFHGKNIVLSSPLVEVVGPIIIDTSGHDGKPVETPGQAKSGQISGRNGDDGEDGLPGESAGHVFIQAKTINRSKQLQIRANGGKGGQGQNGGDGKAGEEGRNGANGHIPESEYNWWTSEICYKIDRGTSGRVGQKGGDGGAAGLGGAGGLRGDIDIAYNHSCGTLENKNGAQGQDGRFGKGAIGGLGGRDGVDMGVAWHNYEFAFGEYRTARGQLDVVKQDVWHGGNGWTLKVLRTESQVRQNRATNGTKGKDGTNSIGRAHDRKVALTKDAISKSTVSSLSASTRMEMMRTGDLANLEREQTKLENQVTSEHTQKYSINKQINQSEGERRQAEKLVLEAQEAVGKARRQKSQLEIFISSRSAEQASLQRAQDNLVTEKEAAVLHLNDIEGAAMKVQEDVHQLVTNQLQIEKQAEMEQVMRRENQVGHISEYDLRNLEAGQDSSGDGGGPLVESVEEKFCRAQQSLNFDTEDDIQFPLFFRQFLQEQQLLQSASLNGPEGEGAWKMFLADEYRKNKLPADTKIFGECGKEMWVNDNPQFLENLFRLISYKGKSIGEFILYFRLFPFNLKTIEETRRKLRSLYVKPSQQNNNGPNHQGQTLVQHLNNILVEQAGNFVMDTCASLAPPEALQKIKIEVQMLHEIFVDLEELLGEDQVSMGTIYTIFLKLVTPDPDGRSTFLDKQAGNELLWQQFILQVTGIRIEENQMTVETAVINELKKIEGSLPKIMEKDEPLKNTGESVQFHVDKLKYTIPYLQLTPEILQKLHDQCDHLLPSIWLPHRPLFDQIRELQKTIHLNYLENFQRRKIQEILDRVRLLEDLDLEENGTRDKALDKIGHLALLLESPFSPFQLKCRLQFYDEMLTIFPQPGATSGGPLDNEENTEPAEPPSPSFIFKKLDEVAVKMVAARKKCIKDFSTIDDLFSRFVAKLDKMLFPDKEKLRKNVEPKDILAMIRSLRTMNLFLHHGDDLKTPSERQESSACTMDKILELNKLIGNFLSGPSWSKWSGHCALENGIRTFQLNLRPLWHSILNKQFQKMLSDRQAFTNETKDKIDKILKILQDILETSTEILFQSEILGCVRAHLVKLVDGLETQVLWHKQLQSGADLHDKVMGHLKKIEVKLKESRNQQSPRDFIKVVAKTINDESINIPLELATENCCVANALKLLQVPDDLVKEYQGTPKKSDFLKLIRKSLENFPSLQQNSKERQNNFQNILALLRLFQFIAIHGSRMPPEILDLTSESEKTAGNNDDLAQTIQKLDDCLAAWKKGDDEETEDDLKLTEEVETALEKLRSLLTSLDPKENDWTYLLQHIDETVLAKQKDFQMGVTTIFQTLKAVLSDLFWIYSKCPHDIISFGEPVHFFFDTLAKEVLPILENGAEPTSKDWLQLDNRIDKLHGDSVMKYFSKISIPTMPLQICSEVHGGKNLMEIFLTFHNQASTPDGGNGEVAFLTLYHRLMEMISDSEKSELTCKSIFDWCTSLEQSRLKFQNASKQNESFCAEINSKFEQIQLALVTLSQDTLLEKQKIVNQTDGGSKLWENIVKWNQCAQVVSDSQAETVLLQCEIYMSIEQTLTQFSHSGPSTPLRERTIDSILHISILDLFQEKLNTFHSDVPPLHQDGLDVLNFLLTIPTDFNNGRKWTKILAILILTFELNHAEKEFCHRVLQDGQNVRISWNPPEEAVTLLQNMIQNEAQVNRPSPDSGFSRDDDDEEMEEEEKENRLTALFISGMQIEDSKITCLSFLTLAEQFYVSQLTQLTRLYEPKERLELLKKVQKFVLGDYPSSWLYNFREEVVNLLFTRLLNLCLDQNFEQRLMEGRPVGKVDTNLMANLKAEFCEFRNSHWESEMNGEALTLLAEKYDKVHPPISGRPPLVTTVRNVLDLKHLFNRHFFLATSSAPGNDDFSRQVDQDIFTWLNLLVDRCTTEKMSLPDLNNVLSRSVLLSYPELIKIMKNPSLNNTWVATMWTQSLVKSYARLFQKNLAHKQSLQKNIGVTHFKRIVDKSLRNPTPILNNIFVTLVDKLEEELEFAKESTTLDTKVVFEIAQHLSQATLFTEDLFKELRLQPLGSWIRKFREHKLLEKFDRRTTNAILKSDEKYGTQLTNNFLNKLLYDFPDLETDDALLTFLDNFNQARWTLDQILIDKLSTLDPILVGTKEGGLSQWNNICIDYASELRDRRRDSQELVRLMRENPKNSTIFDTFLRLPESTNEDTTATKYCLLERRLEAIQNAYKQKSSLLPQKTLIISKWSREDIQEWVRVIISGTKSERMDRVDSNMSEVLAVICRGLKILKKFGPRCTQIISVVILLDHALRQKGCLVEVSTGEGKTFIVAMLVIVRVLCGDDVDVITSSSVLAEENLKEVTPFFELFQISAGQNCDQEAERDEKIRRKRYGNQVIYGDIASFQRDVLLTEFFQKGITAGRTADTVFVDEVDSMLLDKGENVLYLSHTIPDAYLHTLPHFRHQSNIEQKYCSILSKIF